MISIKQNANFTNWYQVFSFGRLIDEISQKAKAVHFAKHLAKQEKQNYINIEGKATKV
tara:strand:+ start:40 stop:213 length:174 start_codon:yes stop_codon:yes gene_type:complete